MSISNKLAEIQRLVNQFSSSIKHKPFSNELDKARTLGFITALRNVLAGAPRVKLPEKPNELFAEPRTPFEEQREINRKGLESLRHLRKGNQND